MNIKGGALEFDIIANNGQINSALDETKRRIQGFTDATVEGGDRMEAAYKEAAAQIEAAFKDIDTMAAIHSNAIADLEKEYSRLGEAAGAAFMKGTAKGDEEYRALTAKQQAIKDEITYRKALLQEVAKSADALAEEERAFKKRYEEVQKNAAAQKTFRTQLREVREELAAMELAGETNSEAYAKLQARFGQLSEAMDAVTTQANILKKGERGWEGLISGISGVAGAFAAAQGAAGLFAGENENLQKIMVKVQSLMSITIGLREVQLMLDKDEAFRLVTLNKLKKAYNAVTLASCKALMRLGVSAKSAKVAVMGFQSVLTLGLSVAIGLVIKAIDKYNEKQEEAKRKAEELIEIERDGRAEMIKKRFEIESTIQSIKNFNGTRDEEKTKVKELNDKYGSVFGTYKTLAEWYDVLSKKAGDYIQILFKQAKIQSLVNKAAESDEEVQRVKYTDKDDVDGSMGWFAKFGLYQAQSNSYGSFDAQKAIDEYNAEAKEKAIKAAEDIRDGYLNEAEKLQKEIGDLQAEFNIGLNLDSNEDSNNKQEDPFIKELEDRKIAYEEYFKFINSTDDIAQQAAREKYASILSEGATYLEYLKKRRDEILSDIGTGKATKQQSENLAKLNKAIVDESTATILGEFENALQTQLSGVDSILDKINIIAQKRKELETDDSGLTKEKGAVLDTEQANIATQAQEDYAKAMRDYNDYLQSKIDAELSYLNRRKELEVAIAKETDAERKKILETQLKTLDTTQQLKQTMDYDALVEEYKTYQQKREAIAAEYDEKIRLASQHADSGALVTELEKAKENALSELTLDEIMSSDTFTELFGNLDTLTVSEMIKLRNKLESEWAKLNLSPKELEALRDRLDEVNNKIQTKNPFTALADAIKRYKEAQDKDLKKGALKDIFEDAATSINLVKDSFDAVTGALSNMGLVSDEATQQVLDDISNMMSSAAQIASGTPQGIIQGTVGLISSTFDLFNFRDRKLEKQIKKHANSLKQLQRVYDEIERSVDNALGSDKFTTQKDSIENMKRQQKELAAMADAERAKKKTDQGKVDEYENQIIELRHQIEDTVQSMRDDIIGSSAADIASQLGNAFIEAFAAGENAAEAFRNKANEVVKNIIQNMLIKKLLEEPVGRIIDKYASKWIDDDGNFAGFDAVINSAGKMGDELAALSSGFAKAMESLPDEIKNQFIDEADPTTSLSGAIKGASQESIDLLAGQTNAVRVNQVQEIEILRQQLIHLANIDGKLSVSNRHLEQIEKNTSGSASDPLRAQGITM